MISYELEDSDIFYVRFSKTVSFEDVKSYLETFEQIDALPDRLLLLYDLLNTDLKVSADEISEILRLSDKATNTYLSVKTAFLVSDPMLTALSMLYSQDQGKDNKIRKVFTTEEAARTWLLS